ncbi:hypothetical protein NGR_c19160 [Sinorhizobium fredii NGR234]|uniref:Chromosomal replication initiator DnaA C-terminal domain-containing protein n=2 Tax=Rhizobium fredii TaxID=380 RepID=C3ME11_SINFN|nr:hypothetical protein NGR_c19160 [Sinorhizobium fredii NGR234]
MSEKSRETIAYELPISDLQGRGCSRPACHRAPRGQYKERASDGRLRLLHASTIDVASCWFRGGRELGRASGALDSGEEKRMTSSQLARQHRHYLAVRERLVRSAGNSGRWPAIAELEAQLAELATANATKARRIATLEEDLADAQARLLAQAQMLLSGRRADDGDEADCDRSSIEEIVAAVLADFPGVTWADIVSVRRDRQLVKPRHACMRAVYEKRKDLSLPRIGRIFHRDHTTVLAVVNRPVP